MSDLATTFMKLELRNPIVVGSSHLTSTIRKLRACEKAGAGAVVVKSIFERAVRADAREAAASMKSPSASNREALLDEIGQNLSLDEYLAIVEEAKRSLEIPVIASIHCESPRAWEEYASRLEGVGADALQLNLFDLGSSPTRTGAQIEKHYLEVVRRVRRRINLPVAAKLGHELSSPAHFCASLRDEGIDGLVLFNRFYGPEVDVDRVKLTSAPVLSCESEALSALRWIGILSDQLEIDFAASGGVHTRSDVLKQILVGARVVEMCTALYTNGLEHISRMTAEITGWMKKHKFSTISDFRGLLSQGRSSGKDLFESTQYMELRSR